MYSSDLHHLEVRLAGFMNPTQLSLTLHSLQAERDFLALIESVETTTTDGGGSPSPAGVAIRLNSLQVRGLIPDENFCCCSTRVCQLHGSVHLLCMASTFMGLCRILIVAFAKQFFF